MALEAAGEARSSWGAPGPSPEQLLAAEKHVLEMVASGAALEDVLETLVRSLEVLFPGTLASVLLVEDGRLRLGAAPSLPAEYNRAVDGVPVGPSEGSCGTAAFRGETVVVADIATDPLWEGYRHLALPHGLRSCWSAPILSGEEVVGTFALYYREPRRPGAGELDLVDRAASLAGIAIQRARAERRLRESEERYRAISDLTTDFAFCHRVEPDGSLVREWVTEAYGRVTGYEPDGVDGREGWPGVVRPEDLPAAEAALARLLSGDAVDTEVRLVGKDGAERCLRIYARPEFEEGRVVRVIGAAQDVTARRRAEEELERSLALLRGTLDATADGILVVDATGRIVTHNRRFAEMWRIPPDVLASGEDGRAISYVLDQLVDPDGFVSKVRELYADAEAESRDVLEFKDGRVFERYSKPQRFADGSVGRVWSFRDVTERRRGEEALRVAEERYRKLLEGLPAVVYLAEFGESGPWRYVSPRIEQLLGFTPDEWMADPDLWYRRLHPDDRERAAAEEARARATGEPLRTEYRMIARDGREVWVRDEAVVVPDEQGRPGLLQGVMSDVTERRRAEEALRRQKEELVALHETTLGLIERLDVTSLLEAVVARAAALVGTEHGYLYVAEGDELVCRVGTGLFAGFVGTRVARGAGLAGRVWERGEALTVDDYSSWSGRHPVFQGVPARAVAGIPLWAGGQVAGVIGVSRLEEGRTFTEEEMELLDRFARLASLALENARLYQALQSELAERRQAEERYRQIFENAVVGIYQTTLDGRFVAANPAVARMLGYGSPEELMASVTDAAELYVDPQGRERFIEEMRRQGEGDRVEFQLRRADGSTIWVSDKARALFDAEGRLVGFEGTLIDVTERKRADEALRQAYERERQAAEGLRALDEMKNAFMAAVSHELRTPLSSILGFAVTLEREDVRLTPEEQRDLLRRLASNARKLDRLLSDLLDLDRLNRGILQPHCRPSDLAELVRRAVAECEDFLATRTVHVEAERVVIPVDASKVERIVENLLANAAKHTPPDSPIWVRVRGEAGGAILVVEDAGPGVPAELRSKVFEPFRRGAPLGHAPGTGIGLSLVDRFAALHGGRAWLEDRPGGGASFRVFLPGT